MGVTMNKSLTSASILSAALALSACASADEAAAPQATVTVTATPEAAPTPSETTETPSETTETPSETAEAIESQDSSEATSASTMSPADFALSARGDLRDLLKDAGDAQEALDEGGTFRLISNGGGMTFNVGQLQALEPPKPVASEWNRGLAVLDQAVQDYVDAVGGDSVSKIQRTINEIERSAEALKEVAESAAP